MKKLVLLLTITMGLFSFNNAHTDHFNIDTKKAILNGLVAKLQEVAMKEIFLFLRVTLA